MHTKNLPPLKQPFFLINRVADWDQTRSNHFNEFSEEPCVTYNARYGTLLLQAEFTYSERILLLLRAELISTTLSSEFTFFQA